MPRIIEYPTVLERMTDAGFKCNYYNSGAFGFAGGVKTFVRGWVGPADGTIREEFLPSIRTVAEPYEESLANGVVRFWEKTAVPAVWVMPKSHWHFELHDGSREGLAEELR